MKRTNKLKFFVDRVKPAHNLSQRDHVILAKKATDLWHKFLRKVKVSRKDVQKLKSKQLGEMLAAYASYLDAVYNYKPNTIENYCYWLTKELTYLSKADKTPLRQALKNIRSKDTRPIKQAPPITLDQLNTFLNSNAPLQHRAMFAVWFYTGMRVSEIIQITLDDVDIQEDCIFISIRKSKTQKNEPLTKVVPYIDGTNTCPYTLLLEWLEKHPRSNKFLFFNNWGNAYSRTLLNTYIKRYFGKEYSSHSFRAGCITFLVSQGWNAFEIADVTGHKSLDILKRYYRVGKNTIANKLRNTIKNITT